MNRILIAIVNQSHAPAFTYNKVEIYKANKTSIFVGDESNLVGSNLSPLDDACIFIKDNMDIGQYLNALVEYLKPGVGNNEVYLMFHSSQCDNYDWQNFFTQIRQSLQVKAIAAFYGTLLTLSNNLEQQLAKCLQGDIARFHQGGIEYCIKNNTINTTDIRTLNQDYANELASALNNTNLAHLKDLAKHKAHPDTATMHLVWSCITDNKITQEQVTQINNAFNTYLQNNL
jgi:hypothetical protein